jgi:serine/threonine-protein kinase RsbW
MDPSFPPATLERSADRPTRRGRALKVLSAPAVAEEVGRLRRSVSRAAVDAGATESERADIALAVSEALTNVVRHAYTERAEPGPMWVGTAAQQGSFVVEVRDEGSGMRPRLDSEGAGLGLAMMSALAVELTLGAGDAGRGTRVMMRFALAGAG